MIIFLVYNEILYQYFLKSHFLKYHTYFTSQLGPGAAGDKKILRVPIWTFHVTQGFFSRDLFMFWSLGYPRVRGSGWWSHSCVKNLPWLGVEVGTKFGGDQYRDSGVKDRHRYKGRYKQSVFIYIDTCWGYPALPRWNLKLNFF